MLRERPDLATEVAVALAVAPHERAAGQSRTCRTLDPVDRGMNIVANSFAEANWTAIAVGGLGVT